MLVLIISAALAPGFFGINNPACDTVKRDVLYSTIVLLLVAIESLLAAVELVQKWWPFYKTWEYLLVPILTFMFGATIWMWVTVWDLFNVDAACKQGWDGFSYMTF